MIPLLENKNYNFSKILPVVKHLQKSFKSITTLKEMSVLMKV